MNGNYSSNINENALNGYFSSGISIFSVFKSRTDCITVLLKKIRNGYYSLRWRIDILYFVLSAYVAYCPNVKLFIKTRDVAKNHS